MGLDPIAEGVDRFEAYLTGPTNVIGHADRTAPLHSKDACPTLDHHGSKTSTPSRRARDDGY
jgi:hypothetical protein